ncbi:MAG: hypothetical protein OXG58_07165 [Gemmatimonadetes bacterium]|nr:hypothetical protein [Gemmatimonadota bacterium]MCY3943908.1 hypothetical protein [Gemmatimonadota bacterium]
MAIEIRHGLSPSLGRGFRSEYADLAPERAFVVYASEERYPVAESVEVIGLREMARMLGNPAALRS